MFSSDLLLEVHQLKKYYRPTPHTIIKAINDVSFQIRTGEIFALVGESGSGKSTVARCIMRVCPPSGGQIFYDGIEITDPGQRRRNKKRLQTELQIIFQDSVSALNQRMTVEQIIAEPLQLARRCPQRSERQEYIFQQLAQVGLDSSYTKKYPPELSGGQRQRVSIARALAMQPHLLVADEPLASLDVSMQAQIVNLFQKLQSQQGFSFLLISHDLSMVRFISDRIAVMCRGHIVEIGPTNEVCDHPLHPYTQALISAVPLPDPRQEREKRQVLFTDFPSLEKGTLQPAGKEHYVLRES